MQTSLPIPDIANLLDEQSFVSDSIRYYPFPSNLRRRYEELDRFPEGVDRPW